MMAYFRIIKIPNLLFYLPIYFFSLSVSPNFTEDSIFRSLILLIVAAISFRGIQEFFSILRSEYKIEVVDVVMVCLIFALLITTGFFLFKEYLLTLIVLTIIVSLFSYSLPDSNPFELSITLFILSYLTINQYDFKQFFQFEVVLASLISVPMMFLYYKVSGVRKGFVLPFLALSVYLLIIENGYFIFILALAFIPKIAAMYSRRFFLKTIVITDYLMVITIICYFIYFLLYGAHLIQVVGF